MDWGHESEQAKVVERFEDLPRVRDADEARRVHNAAGAFFLSKALVAHETFTCMHVVEIETVVDKPRWRVATDREVRLLGGRWCESCCGI